MTTQRNFNIDDIVWEDPPRRELIANRALVWDQLAGTLLARPNQWVRLPFPVKSTGHASSIKANLNRRRPGYQVTTRRNDRDEIMVYAKYSNGAKS